MHVYFILGGQNLRKLDIQFLLVLSIILALTLGSGCLRDFETESYYNIKDMDISAVSIGTAVVDLNVTTYVEKYQGDAEKNTSLLLKVYSRESGLLETQEEVELGAFESGETKAVSQAVSLPKTGGYELRTVLFEEKTQKCSGEIEIYNLDILPADLQDIGLEIPEIDFQVREVKDGKVLIESDIYLANEAQKPSQNFQMLVKAREMDAGLLADKVWTGTGIIEPQTTTIKSVNITVPDQYNYEVEVLIWNNNTIVKRGEDYIQLSPKIKIKDGTKTTVKTIETSDFESSEDEELIPEYRAEEEDATPGFGMFLSVVLLSAAGIFISRRRLR